MAKAMKEQIRLTRLGGRQGTEVSSIDSPAGAKARRVSQQSIAKTGIPDIHPASGGIRKLQHDQSADFS